MGMAQPTHTEPANKCCRSEIRCLSCPVVVMRMRRLEAAGIGGEDLAQALERARTW
jgi:hypothetical protein